ncbi:MAG: hypothetical protein J6Y37_08580 [Paludibacteraceae bacterium]|nr:hypothetical protein [Paludibacteraceae bacterium]
MTDTEKAKAYDEAVAYAKRVLDGLAEDYRCTHMTKDDIKNQYSRLFPHEEAFQDDEDSFACRKLIYGLKSLIQQGKETFAGADITDLIDYLERKKNPFKEPIDGVLYAAACGIKNKGQIEESENPKKGLHSGSLRKVDNPMKWMEEDAKEPRLEEEIEKYLPQIREEPYNEELREFARYFARWGAEHARSEIMKEAKELTPAEGLEDILLEFYDEYDSNVENRPIIPRIYAEKLTRHLK